MLPVSSVGPDVAYRQPHQTTMSATASAATEIARIFNNPSCRSTSEGRGRKHEVLPARIGS
jgi:hypothetical protein